jgi:hypothetical protein
MKVLQNAILVAVFLLTAAHPTGSVRNGRCTAHNNAIGDKAKAISCVAISRGNVAKVGIPLWAPGRTKAVSVIKNRQTAKIEKLQEEQAAMYDARRPRAIAAA